MRNTEKKVWWWQEFWEIFQNSNKNVDSYRLHFIWYIQLTCNHNDTSSLFSVSVLFFHGYIMKCKLLKFLLTRLNYLFSYFNFYFPILSESKGFLPATILKSYSSRPGFSSSLALSAIENSSPAKSPEHNRIEPISAGTSFSTSPTISDPSSSRHSTHKKANSEILEATSSTRDQFRLDYAFAARSTLELSVKEGEIVDLIEESDMDGNREWWLVSNSEGKQGYVPANYMSIVQYVWWWNASLYCMQLHSSRLPSTQRYFILLPISWSYSFIFFIFISCCSKKLISFVIEFFFQTYLFSCNLIFFLIVFTLNFFFFVTLFISVISADPLVLPFFLSLFLSDRLKIN